MAKGIRAAPKKRKKKRLSEHAQLVEERARSIPPRVVHELFDTSTLPVPPPAPHRPGAPGRLVSKPPPPPPRPSRPPEDGEEAELEDLEGVEDIDDLEEIDASEESHSDAFGSHTISPSTAPEPRSPDAARGRSPRSRALPAVLGAAIVGALALVTGRELGRSRSAEPRVDPLSVATAAARPPALPSPPPAPVADDLPLVPPGAVVEATAAPAGGTAAVPSAAPAAETPLAASSTLSARGATSPPAGPGLLAAASSPAGGAVAAASERGGPAPFDGAVADAAIKEAFARAQSCRSAGDPKGSATVTLTYAPSGRVTTALVSGSFAGTSIGSCIAAVLRSARIAPFTGALVTIKRTAAFE
jgi:serine/threonine-protein kinase